MHTWNDVHFALTAQDKPTVCRHENCVTMSIPGYCSSGRGFCLELTRAHLDMARRLVAALEALPPLPSETEPFEGDTPPAPTKETTDD